MGLLPGLFALATILGSGGVAVQSRVPAQDLLFSISSVHAGKVWVFEVSRQRAAKAPQWSESADAPPLPPRAAITAAKAQLQQLAADAELWQFSTVKLRPTSLATTWVYLVEFSSPPESVNELRSPSGSVAWSLTSHAVDLVVLMDGTTVVPSVVDRGQAGGETVYVPPPPPPAGR